MVRKGKDGQPDWSNLWAQQIFRSQSAGKEYIFALVRRKYGPSDVESQGPGDYIGISVEPIYEMVTDTDPDSETFNTRIPKENTVFDGAGREKKQKVQAGVDYRPIHEVSKEVLDNYRKLVGHMPKPHGTTQFYWLFPEGKYAASDMKEFFEQPLDKVAEVLIKRKTIMDKKKKKDEDAEE